MKELLFATHNSNKAREIEQMLDGAYTLLTLDDAGVTADIPETEHTLEGNALLKARFLHQLTGKACFADDTGLEVEALNGEPGVYTARYAGDDCNPQKNMAKLLKNLEGNDNRRAQFRTVVAYITAEGEEKLFEGICKGSIATQQSGNEGFGYDPVFCPDAANDATTTRTFAEMSLDEKNKISHRGLAVREFTTYLRSR